MVRIGLPKGVIKRRSVSLIEAYTGCSINADKLNFQVGSDLTFYLLKHRDIPGMIAKGVLNFGITSTEWVYETGHNLEVVQELDWCDTRVSLITERNSPVLARRGEINCITEFPQTAKRFFDGIEWGGKVTIHYVNGSSEGFVPTVYDCCVDCVETGKTLHLHNLMEERVILYSKVVVVMSKHLNKSVCLELSRFLEQLEVGYEIHSVNGV